MMHKSPLDFHVIIPARYHSSRLPGKLLMDLAGQTVLERVYRQALKAHPSTVTIATDHHLIQEAAEAFGARVVMTSADHPHGTARIAELVLKDAYPKDAIIVNLQGDEPFMPAALIHQVAMLLSSADAPVATLVWPIADLQSLLNPSVVKVAMDRYHHALYFSRSRIPANRDAPSSLEGAWAHIGIYAYRAGFLLELVKEPPCRLEEIECLEQLRVLWLGHRIKVQEALDKPGQDINTLEDFERACGLCAPIALSQ